MGAYRAGGFVIFPIPLVPHVGRNHFQVEIRHHQRFADQPGGGLGGTARGLGDLDLAALDQPQHPAKFRRGDAFALEDVNGADEFAPFVLLFGGPGFGHLVHRPHFQARRLRQQRAQWIHE